MTNPPGVGARVRVVGSIHDGEHGTVLLAPTSAVPRAVVQLDYSAGVASIPVTHLGERALIPWCGSPPAPEIWKPTFYFVFVSIYREGIRSKKNKT